jgi:hypothetical protein
MRTTTGIREIPRLGVGFFSPVTLFLLESVHPLAALTPPQQIPPDILHPLLTPPQQKPPDIMHQFPGDVKVGVV